MVQDIHSVQELNDVFKAAGDKYVFVDFHAQWCGPCKRISPQIEVWAAKYSETVVVLKVDVDDATDVAEKYEISAMPTFILFKNGTKVNTVVGADPAKVEALFQQ